MYNLKQHIAIQNEYVEAVADEGYFEDFIVARDALKAVFAEPRAEQIEEQEEDFEDFED